MQGKEFCNQIMDRLEVLTGFKHRVTSAYHPQSNGLDERLNQTLKGSLQKLVNDMQDDWDNFVDNVLFAYRTSRQDSTKFTPFDDKVMMFVETKKKIHNQNIERAQEKQKKQYDKKHAAPSAFRVGVRVLRKDFTRKKRRGGKMDPKWLGPYLIEKDLGRGRYKLRSVKDTSDTVKVNGIHLKVYKTNSLIKSVMCMHMHVV